MYIYSKMNEYNSPYVPNKTNKYNSPYVPSKAIFHESISQPKIFNEQNNRLERVISDMKEIVKDTICTKNIVMGSVQELHENNEKNTLLIYNKLNAIEQEQLKTNKLLVDIFVSLGEIKDRLTEYEVEPEYEGIDPDEVDTSVGTRIKYERPDEELQCNDVEAIIKN